MQANSDLPDNFTSSAPSFDLSVKDDLYCREYLNYDALEKTPKLKSDLLKTMVTGCSALEELGIKYFISKGSALGFKRNGGFRPTESDIDIDIISGDEQIYKLIRRLPFEDLFITSNKGHYQQYSLIDSDTRVILDLCIFHKTDQWLVNRNYFGYFWLPACKVETLQYFSLDGYSFPIPDLNWYCNFWYGPNWQTPRKYGKDWSVDYRRDCGGLIYTGAKDIVYEKYFKE